MPALKLGQRLTFYDDLSDFVMTHQKGVFEIVENIFGILFLNLLFHVSFYISNLIIIEMIKKDFQEDNFVTDDNHDLLESDDFICNL